MVTISLLSYTAEAIRSSSATTAGLRVIGIGTSHTANGIWPRSSASFRLETSGEHPRLSGLVEFAKVEDILPLVAAVTRPTEQQLERGRARGLRGELVATEFSLGMNPNEPLAVKLHADVNGLGADAAGPLPGFSGVSGLITRPAWQPASFIL